MIPMNILHIFNVSADEVDIATGQNLTKIGAGGWSLWGL
jgi:hypothetical protein